MTMFALHPEERAEAAQQGSCPLNVTGTPVSPSGLMDWEALIKLHIQMCLSNIDSAQGYKASLPRGLEYECRHMHRD